MIYKAIKYILENDSDFNTAVSGIIFPIHPRREVAPPFSVFSVSNMVGNPTKDNPTITGLDNYSVRVSVYDVELDDVIDLAEKARTALDNEKDGGVFNGVTIDTIDFETLNDAFDSGYGDRGLLVMDLNFNIWSLP